MTNFRDWFKLYVSYKAMGVQNLSYYGYQVYSCMAEHNGPNNLNLFLTLQLGSKMAARLHLLRRYSMSCSFPLLRKLPEKDVIINRIIYSNRSLPNKYWTVRLCTGMR